MAYQIPTSVNGYPIITTSHTQGGVGTREGHVILVDRAATDEHNYGVARCDRYVTAWLGLDDDQWCHGHYISNFDDACEDFKTRAVRGY